jgi:hypothetical protein
MQGTDVSRLVLGKTEQGPGSAYFQIFGPYHAGGVERAWRGVRTERYMFARWESGPWLLYDVEKDPYELNNLVKDGGFSSQLQELDKNLLDWMHRVGDSWSLDWTAPIEDDGRLYEYRTFSTVQDYFAWARKHPYLAPGIS